MTILECDICGKNNKRGSGRVEVKTLVGEGSTNIEICKDCARRAAAMFEGERVR